MAGHVWEDYAEDINHRLIGQLGSVEAQLRLLQTCDKAKNDLENENTRLHVELTTLKASQQQSLNSGGFGIARLFQTLPDYKKQISEKERDIVRLNQQIIDKDTEIKSLQAIIQKQQAQTLNNPSLLSTVIASAPPATTACAGCGGAIIYTPPAAPTYTQAPSRDAEIQRLLDEIAQLKTVLASNNTTKDLLDAQAQIKRLQELFKQLNIKTGDFITGRTTAWNNLRNLRTNQEFGSYINISILYRELRIKFTETVIDEMTKNRAGNRANILQALFAEMTRLFLLKDPPDEIKEDIRVYYDPNSTPDPERFNRIEQWNTDTDVPFVDALYQKIMDFETQVLKPMTLRPGIFEKAGAASYVATFVARGASETIKSIENDNELMAASIQAKMSMDANTIRLLPDTPPTPLGEFEDENSITLPPETIGTTPPPRSVTINNISPGQGGAKPLFSANQLQGVKLKKAI